MKKIILIILMLALVGCTANTGNIVADTISDYSEVNLQIEGMYCQTCAIGVEYQFEQVSGVFDADVNWQSGKATVKYDPEKTNPQEIVAASDVYIAKITK